MKSCFAAIPALAAGLVLAPTLVSADPWNGPYVGAAFQIWDDDTSGGEITAGYNFQAAPSFVLGGEISYFFGNGDYFNYFATARAGVLVSEEALIYAMYGLGSYGSNGSTVDSQSKLGIGAEFAVSDMITVRGEFAFQNCCGDPVMDGPQVTTFGVYYHF